MVLKQHPTVEFEEKLIMFFPDFLENFVTKWCGFFKTKKGGVELDFIKCSPLSSTPILASKGFSVHSTPLKPKTFG